MEILPVPELTPFGIRTPPGKVRIPLELIAFIQRREFERSIKLGKFGKGNKIIHRGRLVRPPAPPPDPRIVKPPPVGPEYTVPPMPKP